MIGMPRLSIIIVTYNIRADLERCLHSLVSHKPHVDHEIVVVDNESTDDTVETLRARWTGIRLIEAGSNVGFSRANNIGIRQSATPSCPKARSTR
jgi:GT2 family glycosyltransferase